MNLLGLNLRRWFRGRPEFAVLPAQSQDAHEIAVIHAAAFARGWTDGEIEQLLARSATHGVVAREVGRQTVLGFILYTLAAGEGEILTVAAAVGWRRYGIGEMLVRHALRHATAERARSVFLEVGEDNTAAVSLYRKLGFRQVGTRKNYYRGEAHGSVNALVMRRDLA